MGVLDGREEGRHVLPEALQAVGATALQSVQVPPAGIHGPLEQRLLPPET